ncbi:MAG: hypothetical protein KKE24_04635 [Candidatus Thermoplasmatota archaeon]|nr:hypothetical protein [Candidatus Thermoplasmatota archaeon]
MIVRSILTGTLCIAIVGCLICASGASEAISADSGWGIATLIEIDDAGDAQFPDVAVDASGNAIAVWEQDDGIRNNILSSRYVVGTGWGTPMYIELDSETAHYPKVALDDSGNATAVWQQSDGVRYNIWSNRYVIGSGWVGATLVETDDVGSAYHPEVAVDESGNAIAVWYQDDASCYSIYSNRYVVGTGWGAVTPIETSDLGNAYDPQVAVDDSGNAIAVWYQYDGAHNNIYTNRYFVGTGWGMATLLETDDMGNAYYPQIAIDGLGDAIAVWYQSNGVNYDVYSNRYVVGTGWGTVTLVETDDAEGVGDPQVVVDDSGNAMVVWEQFDGAIYSIWSNRYVVGTGWGTETLVETEDLRSAHDPQIAIDGSGNAVAVWGQYDGTRVNIHSNRYVVGTGWGTATLIETDNAGSAYYPQIAIDCSGDATVIWHQSDGDHYNVWVNRFVAPDVTPPSLSLDDPADGITTETSTVTVSGTTEIGVTLGINGISVVVESDGSFACEIALFEGNNTITVTATDASDNSASTSVNVTYINPIHALEEELNDAIDELDATQDDLAALEDELDATQIDLDATDEELSGTSDDLDAMKSLNLVLMALLGVIAILAVVMLVMFLSLRKKIAGMDKKSVVEGERPPPQN